MLTLGVDLGKRHSQFAVLDDTGYRMMPPCTPRKNIQLRKA
jgi:hypothetical protein